MNTVRVTFLLVFVLAVSLGQADKDENRMEMQEKTEQGKSYLDFAENLLLQKLEELEAKPLEEDSEESRNSRQKRCIGEGVPCDENDPRCCSGLVCLKPTLHGIWYKSYYCYKK
uniref:U11-theraphotoxin-Hhn1a n=1 Tax=Cyriopagopus hainanus TaxID=2781057 RepID=H16A5_CYRHA|nr:RecName: Full=U11-theraphotoxin-Hhn1a; Short=U11-TRTX-Hhn1a; AltName: Full=Hainantoxin-XVI.5; Short=HNTX-XVI.5; AltName: Full=Peptide F4-19.87; Flags: Precursor [Haplopelma hainanum]ADB56750.1 HNTX-XVI.5 precursor [Haplopelma hainanum]